MRFYHIADVHLGAVPDRGMSWSKERARGLFESLYRVLEQARENHIDMVFICGDLFHRQPLARELSELNYRFEKAAPVLIFIIAGNHDYIHKDSSYVNFKWSRNVKLITPDSCQRIYIEQLNTCIYGFSYHHYEIAEPLYDSLAPICSDGRGGSLPKDCAHILLAHGGDEKHIPMHFNAMAASGFDYIAMGHIHKPWLSKDGRMAYSGALEPVDKNDEGPHGFIEGEVTGRQVRVWFHPIAEWNYVNLETEADASMSWEAIKDRVSSQIKDSGKNIYKVTLSGFKNVDLSYDIDELYSLGPVVSVTDTMDYDFDFEGLYKANQGNLLGRYMEKVWSMELDEAAQKKVLYYGFNALYKTGEQP